MIAMLLGIMFFFLLLGFPMMLSMIIAPLVVRGVYFPYINDTILFQQLVNGVNSYVLLCVPMFIFAAEIMSKGQMANRLINFVLSVVGHYRGGLAVTTGATCTLFGAISGSTAATLVAVGKPMYGPLLKAGYSSSHAMGLIMNNANIALLIPPGLGMIMYCVVTGTSVKEVFLAGVVPGVLLFLAYAAYDVIYAHVKGMPATRRASLKEMFHAFKEALLALGFPVLVLGGIYSGIFSPTESAAAACLYAIVVEGLVYKSIKWSDFPKIALDVALTTASVLILLAGGQAFSWLITYAQIPQMLTNALLGPSPSELQVLFTITIVFLVACMFVDSGPVIVIVSPIFFPVAVQAGVDPVHLGIVVAFQAAFGGVTPPFGSNIFISSGIFNKTYLEACKGLPPYLIISVIFGVLLILFPEISLVLLNR